MVANGARGIVSLADGGGATPICEWEREWNFLSPFSIFLQAFMDFLASMRLMNLAHQCCQNQPEAMPNFPAKQGMAFIYVL